MKTPFCATTAPANERPENYTVLLVGDLGGVDDPPVLVTVTGDVFIEGDANARGASVAVRRSKTARPWCSPSARAADPRSR